MLFELVHQDLCGHMKLSIGAAQYYIIYIDDCTRYTEVYFRLITTSEEEISAKFRRYQAWVKAQGFHIKRFCSDNGSGKYSNPVFLATLGEKGITYKSSPPYTQHKNGTAERMIQTLNTERRNLRPRAYQATVPHTKHSDSTGSVNREEVEKLLKHEHDAQIRTQCDQDQANLGLQFRKQRTSGQMVKNDIPRGRKRTRKIYERTNRNNRISRDRRGTAR